MERKDLLRRTLPAMRCLLIGGLLTTVWAGGASAAQAGAAHATLRFVSERGYRISVAGHGWPHSSKVTFAVTQGSMTEGLELRTTRHGAFVVGVKNIDLCGGSLFRSRDLKRHSARIRGPALECASPLYPPVPVLTVVKGHKVHITLTHVDRPPTRTIVIRRGAAVYVWEAGEQHPSFTVATPKRYFALIGQGTTPPRACAQVECSAGFFWEWVGMKIGKTMITMTPWCRKSQPPCEAPDYDIRVRIVRRHHP